MACGGLGTANYPARQIGFVRLNSLSVAGKTNIQVKVALMAAEYTTDGTAPYSPTDTLKVQVRPDGATRADAWITIGEFLTDRTSTSTAGNMKLVRSSSNGSSIVTGNLTVQRYIDSSTNPGLGYRHFSSPLSSTTVANLTTASFSPIVNPDYNTSTTPARVRPFPTVYGYDQARLATAGNNLAAFDKDWVSPASTSDALTVGRGYTVSAALPPAAPFDARAAWAEFTDLLRLNYAYFTRPGVDGEAIVAAFAPAAQADPTKAAFRDVLQLVAHNFADPHFIVGPLDSLDYNVVPTSSDLVARYRAGRAELVDVRQDSEAEQQGLRPGFEVVRIEGLTPQAAAEQVMGRPWTALSTMQREAGLTIALAGRIRQTRQLTLAAGRAAPRTYTLRSPGEQARRLRTAPPLRVTQQGGVTIIRFNNSLGNNATIAAFQTALGQAQATSTGLVLDFRNTPSGGNTTVARSIMGHFVQVEKPYQVHVVPSEQRRYGVPRKFVEYVLPLAPYYGGKVVVLGGHWTGSMGEGLLVGFQALGVPTAGSELADLLGALFNEQLELSDAKIDLGEEQLLQVNGQPREEFVPACAYPAGDAPVGHNLVLEQAIEAVR